jgi:hypothetical protein
VLITGTGADPDLSCACFNGEGLRLFELNDGGIRELDRMPDAPEPLVMYENGGGAMYLVVIHRHPFCQQVPHRYRQGPIEPWIIMIKVPPVQHHAYSIQRPN